MKTALELIELVCVVIVMFAVVIGVPLLLAVGCMAALS